MKEVIYYFDFSIQRVGFRLWLDHGLYEYYRKQPKYVSESPHWVTEFYNMFLGSEKDIPLLKQVIAKAEYFGKDIDIKTLAVIRFVQGALSYDFDKVTQTKWQVNYPFETLYLGKGICSDKSILLAKLLILLGYKVVLLRYDKANHIAVGVLVDKNYANYQTPYGAFAVVESTTYSPLGLIQDCDYENEVPEIVMPRINGTRHFTRLRELRENEAKATQMFGKEYLYASAYQKNVLIEIKKNEDKLEEIKKEIEKVASKQDYDALRSRYDKIVKNLQILVGYFNESN